MCSNVNELETKILNAFHSKLENLKQKYLNFLMFGVNKNSWIFHYRTLKN